MKVLMISTDRLICQTGSEVRRRIMDYGSLFDELVVIVLTKKSDNLKSENLTDNVRIIVTGARFRITSIFSAFFKGCEILKGREAASWVVTSQDPFETGLIAFGLKIFYQIPWQVQIHTDLGSNNFRHESLLNLLRFFTSFFIIRFADGVRVVSLRVKNYLVDSWQLKQNITLLPILVESRKTDLTIDSLSIKQKYPKFSFIILMASRLTKEKNFPLALGALAEASKNRPGLGLVIVGSGPEKNKLTKLTQAMGIAERVVFEDWTCELQNFYHEADLFLLTSNYEGYGRTIVEAGLIGCPILSADIGLVGEVATNEDILICPVGDEDCFAEKIGWAVSHQRELSQMALKFKDKLSQNLLTRGKYLTLFRESLNL